MLGENMCFEDIHAVSQIVHPFVSHDFQCRDIEGSGCSRNDGGEQDMKGEEPDGNEGTGVRRDMCRPIRLRESKGGGRSMCELRSVHSICLGVPF